MKQILVDFYELEDVKETAIERNRDINLDDWAYDDVIEFWTAKLDEIGFCNAKIYFTGFWSQGDGACFDNDTCHFDVEKLLNNLDFSEEEKERIYNLKDNFDISIYCKNNHYYHEKTRCIELEDFFIENENDKELLSRFEKQLEDLRLKLCCEIYEALEQHYEYLTSDDAVEETLIANEYLFNKDGSIARVQEA